MSNKPEGTWWHIRAANGDLLASINAKTEDQAFAVYFATEERRVASKPSRHIPDGRTLLGTVH